MPKTILLVDDEPMIRGPLREFLELRGHRVVEADTAEKAREAFRDTHPDLVLLDYSLPDANALELIPRLRELEESVPIVVVTGHGTIDLAVQTMREGAEYFLTKPVQLATLGVLLERIFENAKNKRVQLASRTRESRGDVFIAAR